MNTELVEAEQLLHMLLSQATGGSGDNAEYVKVRAKYIRDPRLKDLVPRFVHTCRDLGHFWEFIKGKFAHYQERRDYLRAEFQPMLEALEKGVASPVQATASAALEELDAAHVRDVWDKALSRANPDPEGAITAARALVESVCKLILDELKVEYADDGDLTKLYKATAKSLNLSADQHQAVFKQILGSCAGVVNRAAPPSAFQRPRYAPYSSRASAWMSRGSRCRTSSADDGRLRLGGPRQPYG